MAERQFDFRADDGSRFALDLDVRPQPGRPVQRGLQWQGEPLLLRTEVAVCHDLKSGLPFPWRVSITLAGKVFHGCGGDPATLLHGADWVPLDAPLLRVRFEPDGVLRVQAPCTQAHARYRADTLGLTVEALDAKRVACWGATDAAGEAQWLAQLPGVLRFSLDELGTGLALRLLDGRTLRLSRPAAEAHPLHLKAAFGQ